MVTTFVINLASRNDRWEKFKNKGYTRWEATSWEDIDNDDPMIDKMISFHNIRHTKQHLAKIGCWKSHMRLLKHIVDNKINKCLILEDDACGIMNIDEDNLLDNCITYMGGCFSHPQITQPLDRDRLEIYYGINLVDDSEFKIMTTLSYYLPTWEIAKELYDKVISCDRYRAIDVMYSQTDIPKAFVYPALFMEQRTLSDIRGQRTKYMDLYYNMS